MHREKELQRVLCSNGFCSYPSKCFLLKNWQDFEFREHCALCHWHTECNDLCVIAICTACSSNAVTCPFDSGRSLTSFHGLHNLVQLVMQWLSGALVLILFIVKRGEFSRQIVTKLGSSFSTVAFVIVVVSLTKLFIFSLFNKCPMHWSSQNSLASQKWNSYLWNVYM